MPYTPTIQDILWAMDTLLTIREGGTLAYPATRLIYTVSHLHGTLTLQNPEVLKWPPSKEVHERTIAVFGWLDYSVLTIN